MGSDSTTPGDPTKPLRHCQNLRPECDPQKEREPQPPPPRIENRRRELARTDGRDDAAGNGQYGKRSQRHGFRDEEHGSREGTESRPRKHPTRILMCAQISAVMDKFETQFEDLDVATGYYENATSSATAVGTPQEDVDKLMNQVADEAGVELQTEMNAAEAPKKVAAGPVAAEEDGLGDRLRALRS